MQDEPIPALETGHEIGTPNDDSYVRRFLLNSAEFNEVVARSAGGSSLWNARFAVADTSGASGFFNSAMLLRPLSSDPASTLDELELFFLKHDAADREVLIFSAWPTPDIESFGWHLGGHPPLHLLPAGTKARSAPWDLEIEPIRDTTTQREAELTAIQGYPFENIDRNQPGVLFPAGVLQDLRVRMWVGRADGRVAGMAVSMVAHGINNVCLVVTLPDFRGRGFGEALTWKASQADPALPAMLLSSDLGRPVYDRMGYLPLFRFTLWYQNRLAELR